MLVDGKYQNRKRKTTLYCSYVETVLQNYIHHILNTSELNCSPTLKWFQFHLFYVAFDSYIAVKGNNNILLPKPHMIYAVQRTVTSATIKTTIDIVFSGTWWHFFREVSKYCLGISNYMLYIVHVQRVLQFSIWVSLHLRVISKNINAYA